MAKNMKQTTRRLSLEKIQCARDVQPRVETDKTAVAEYAERLEANDQLPPVVVFFDGETYWLAEGFHRLLAHKKAGRKQIDCIVIEGTKADAQWHALQSNKSHGLRRTIEDKKHAVLMALEHPKGKDLSDRGIADLVGVSPTLVGKHRPKAAPTVHNGQLKKRVGRDGRMRNTSNIGKNRSGKATLGKKTESEEPAAPTPAISVPVDQQPTRLRAVDHRPNAQGDDPNRLVPVAAPPDDNVETDGQDESREEMAGHDDSLASGSACSQGLIERIDGPVTDIQQILGTILRDEEVAALPEQHGLTVLLRQLEIAAENVADWVTQQRTDATDTNEADEPAQNNADEEEAVWTF